VRPVTSDNKRFRACHLENPVEPAWIFSDYAHIPAICTYTLTRVRLFLAVFPSGGRQEEPPSGKTGWAGVNFLRLRSIHAICTH